MTGLYFGSYNPIHIGHLAIANYMVEYTDLDQVWFVVSPHNPLKKKSSLLPDHHRIELVERAIRNDDRFRMSDIETRLPQPSYTIDTLAYLGEKFPGRKFALIMGSDNLETLHKWKNASELVKLCSFYVYPRRTEKQSASPALDELKKSSSITYINAPMIEISSTFIRKSIKDGKDMRHFLPPGVWDYVRDMHFYET